MIKKIFIFSIACLFACSGTAMAQGRGNFSARLNGLRSQLIGCETVTVTGTVNSLRGLRQTIVIDTGDDLVTVYGIGPDSYWEDQNIIKPIVGDLISVDCCEIAFSNGSIKLRTVSVTTADDDTIVMIDTETGENLSKQTRGNYFGRWRNRNKPE